VDRLISPIYSAEKAGINSITKSFAVQYGPLGIRANAPDFTLSTKNRGIPPRIAEQLAGRAARDVGGTGPGRRVPGLERASFVTGVVVPLDGGWTARLA
jgi:NAD(P)-dependent dehydrogenase (short-subunit alcohol dehydrogenase family)